MDRNWIKRVNGLLLGMSFCAMIFACGVEGEEPFPAEPGKAEVTEGMFTLASLDETNFSMEAQMPIEYLGCPMAGIVDLTLKGDDARVKLGNLKFFAGSFDGFDTRNMKKTREVYGAVLGQGLAPELRETGLVEHLWLANKEVTSAGVMLVRAPKARVSGRGCDRFNYGRYELEGQAHLSVNLELVEGKEAEVGYKVEWFDCSRISDTDDPRKQEVCDQVWGVLFDKSVGQKVKVSTCPFVGDERWCSVWNKAIGTSTREVTEEDVEGAVTRMCFDDVVLDAVCCD